MKKIVGWLLAAGMLLGAAGGAGAADFKARGQWLTGFGLGRTRLLGQLHMLQPDVEGHDYFPKNDAFQASQRLRLRLDAVVSETLSGTVFFEIGSQEWGYAEDGASLGTDGAVIKVKHSYVDWVVPRTELKLRMGLQGVTLPNRAGGSAVLDTDVAGITASWPFNGNAALTALWMRPFNDNYGGSRRETINSDDNMDLFALLLPLKGEGFEITPWVMYGLRGRHTSIFDKYNHNLLSDGHPNYTLAPYMGWDIFNNPPMLYEETSKRYAGMVWAGLPVAITTWAPWNVEVDLNYGRVEGTTAYKLFDHFHSTRDTFFDCSDKREGWVAKALAEYKMDWGTPGIFGWYASGDDGNPKNGSERMPSIVPKGNFTSFMGDGNYGWGPGSGYVDKDLSYAGTWGIGLRLKDVSFVENLKHTLSVAYWGGTNDPSGTRYMAEAYSWNYGTDHSDGPYLTTHDGLLEFNLINAFKIFENFEMNLELGYIVNFVDKDSWDNTILATDFDKRNAWKAQLIFAYNF